MTQKIHRQLMAVVLAIALVATPVAAGGLGDILRNPLGFLKNIPSGVLYAGLYYLVQREFLADSRKGAKKNRKVAEQDRLERFLYLRPAVRNALLAVMPDEYFTDTMGQLKELVLEAAIEIDKADAQASVELVSNTAGKSIELAKAPAGRLEREVIVLFSGHWAGGEKNDWRPINPRVNRSSDFDFIAIWLSEIPATAKVEIATDGQFVRQQIWNKQLSKEGKILQVDKMFILSPLAVDLHEIAVKDQLVIQVSGQMEDGRRITGGLTLLANPAAVQPPNQEEEENVPILPDMSDGRQIIMPPSRNRPAVAERSDQKESTVLASRLRSSEESAESKSQIAHLLRSSEEDNGEIKSEGVRVASAAQEGQEGEE